jgi:NADH-quinone oxidoreductase subunit J
MTFINYIFYFFSAILLLSALMVILMPNPVKGVLFLVLTFFCSSVLWMMLQAEFLSLALIFVYVGAVMTLFLFVVMMLNLDLVAMRGGFVRYLPFGAIVIVLLLGLMLLVIGPKHFGYGYATLTMQPSNYSNTKELGDVLYTQYLYPFEIAAVILLVAIISAISLAFRPKRERKSQNIAAQINVQAKDRVELINMKSE